MAESSDYRPNVKLALAGIATKWNTHGNPVEYLLGESNADLVIDSLLEDGWTILPTEVADAAREVVEAHQEVTELTATPGSFGPRFVEFVNGGGRRVAVNPEHVAAVSEFQGDEDFCTLMGTDGRYLTDADGTLDEVVAKLTGEARS